MRATAGSQSLCCATVCSRRVVNSPIAMALKDFFFNETMHSVKASRQTKSKVQKGYYGQVMDEKLR